MIDIILHSIENRGSGLVLPVQTILFLFNCHVKFLYSKITKYVHIKSTTVYAPRRNWDSPQPPTRRLVCPLPPVSGGRGTLAGLGESQFRRGAYTVVLFICTYFVSEMNNQIKDDRKNISKYRL